MTISFSNQIFLFVAALIPDNQYKSLPTKVF